MAAFTVWIVAPLGDVHWQALREVAAGVVDSLRTLGHNVIFNPGDGPYADGEIRGRLIVFNGHRLGDTKIPADAIIFNAEQIRHTDENFLAHPYAQLLRWHAVWDYSRVNIDRMRTFGALKTVLCPVGYWPGLTDVVPTQPEGAEDVDVLFVGSINDRRRAALDKLVKRRMKVQVLHGVYGAERNAWIARSKVILNCHYYDKPIFEIFRVSHAWANKKCVVTEDGGCDEVLEALAAKAAARVSYDRLAEVCGQLVSSVTLRKDVAECGHFAFSQLPQVEYVARALEATGP